jgi:hypothetical protein
MEGDLLCAESRVRSLALRAVSYSSFSREWLAPRMPVVFVSDNPADDFQRINFYFWRYFGENPFGQSARRFADFCAGLMEDFRSTQKWKRLRRTKHDHHPVHDALGNAEASHSTFRR